MKHNSRVLSFVAAIASLAGVAAAVPSGVGPLTFSDEFDGTLLDLTKWMYRAPGPRFDGVNTPTAVSVGGGMVTIKAFTETNPITAAQTHFGAQIATTSLFEQQYGYFESRVRFHATTGTASAFWLQSPTHGNPQGNPQVAGVEVDIFEHRVFNPFDDQFGEPYDVANNIHAALIWDGYPATGYPTLTKFTPDLPNLINNDPAEQSDPVNGGWHTSGLLWTPEKYVYYFDGEPFWTLTNSPGSPVSQRTEFIVLSMEIFEAFAGDAPPLGYGTLANTTTNVQFDYVRAYAIPEPNGLALAAIGALTALRRRKR